MLEVARQEFLDRGYAGATMEAVARAARISKNSLYKAYGSKEGLYASVVSDWVLRGRDSMRPHLEVLERAPDIHEGLQRLARVLQRAVLSPSVLQMRTLVATEAARAPEVASSYVAQSWDANLRALAMTFAELMRRGSLGSGDPSVAAEQFTWLALGAPLNRLTLTGNAETYPLHTLDRIAHEAVDTFLARFPLPAREAPAPTS